MAEYRKPKFEQFSEKTAQTMLEANNAGIPGLPTFLGVQFEKFEPGRLVATMEIRDDHVTFMGTLHGGVMAGYVDHVMGCVLYPLMPKGQWAATTEFKLNYLAPIKEGVLTAESTVLSMGRRSAVVRVEVVGGGKLVCVAQGTLLIAEPPAARA
jgi:1,4-dihydroxy-2-naphthoyl-CoA hydrolase